MKFLLCSDGSADDIQSANLVNKLNFPSNSQLTLLRVLDNKTEAKFQDDSTKQIKNILGSSYIVGIKNRYGNPIDEITAELVEEPYDLIIVGGGAQKEFLHPKIGSTTKKLVRNVNTHFLIARDVPEKIDRILICAGVDSLVSQTMTLGGAWISNTSATINLLHVIQGKSSDTSDVQHDEILRQAQNELIKSGVRNNIIPIIRKGIIVEEVMSEITSAGYDLLVVGAHFQPGQDPWQGMLLDDVTDQLLNRCSCSMLII